MGATWAGLICIACQLAHTKVRAECIPGCARSQYPPPVSQQWWATIGCDQNVREPNLGADSIGDLWDPHCGTTTLASLYRELGVVTVQVDLNHRTQVTGTHLTLAGAGLGGGQAGPGYSLTRPPTS